MDKNEYRNQNTHIICKQTKNKIITWSNSKQGSCTTCWVGHKHLSALVTELGNGLPSTVSRVQLAECVGKAISQQWQLDIIEITHGKSIEWSYKNRAMGVKCFTVFW